MSMPKVHTASVLVNGKALEQITCQITSASGIECEPPAAFIAFDRRVRQASVGNVRFTYALCCPP